MLELAGIRNWKSLCYGQRYPQQRTHRQRVAEVRSHVEGLGYDAIQLPLLPKGARGLEMGVGDCERQAGTGANFVDLLCMRFV